MTTTKSSSNLTSRAAFAFGLRGRRLSCAFRFMGRGRGRDGSSRDDNEPSRGGKVKNEDEGKVEVETDDATANATSTPVPTSPSPSRTRPPIVGRARTTTTTTTNSPPARAASSSSSSSSSAASPRPPPPRRSRSLPPSYEHYLSSPDEFGGCNASLVPLSEHYDANDALLGLFVSTYRNVGADDDDGGGGESSGLAYAIGRRFVEVALYRIPRHGYYRNGTEGTRRKRSAANAIWVTGLLGKMQAANGDVATMMESTSGGDGDDDGIATLRRLAIEAHRSFEEALDDGGDVRGGVRGGRADDDVDVDVDDGTRDVPRDWGGFILGNDDGGAYDRCYDDAMTMCHSLPENILSFWNNVVGARACAASTAHHDDDDNDNDDRAIAICGARKKRAKIDWDIPSGSTPSGPIEIPRAFVGVEGRSGQALSSERDEEDNGDDFDGLDVGDPRRSAASSCSSDVDDHGGRYPSSLNDLLANDGIMAIDVDNPSIAALSPPSIESEAVALVEDDIKGVKPAVVVRGRSIDSRGFDRDVLRRALSLSMKDDGDLNVVSSSSSGSSGVVADESLGGSIAGGNFESVESMSSLYREQYLALRDNGKFHVRFLDTYQGRNPQTTNGCTVIAPLTCVQYFTSSEQNVVEASPSVEFAWWGGVPDGLLNHVIDEHAASILPDVRKKLRLEGDAFIIPSDVHDHLIEVGLLSTQQFVGVCGGNILDDGHLHAFKSTLLLLDDAGERERLRGRKIAATFFFHGHVVALHVVNGKGKDDNDNAWIELIDSLPDPETWAIANPSPSLFPCMSADQGYKSNTGRSGAETDDEWEHGPYYDEGYELPLNAVRVRCTDIEHFDTLIRHYACSKFSEEERQFIDGTDWEDNNGYCEYSFDPRVFQAFIWAESE